VYDGAPVGVQIIGRKHDEEKIWVIGKFVAERVEEAAAQ
jgi:amidase